MLHLFHNSAVCHCVGYCTDVVELEEDKVAEEELNNFTTAPQDIRLQPFQPRNVKFPFTTCGNKRRSFRAEWFDKYPWLEWDGPSQAAFCHCCRMSTKLRLVTFSHCSDDAFSIRGFSNWKHAHDKFVCHEGSTSHKEAALKWSNYVSSISISTHLKTGLEQQQAQNRQALLEMLSSLRFLARQGLAIRGHTDKTSNYHQLLLLRSADSDALHSLMTSDKRNKWLGHEIENEILERLSNSVLRKLAEDVRADGFFP